MFRLMKRKLCALLLCAAAVLSLAGCGKISGEDFDEFLWELFEDTVTSDTITLHYTLSDPAAYGITPPEVSYGEVDFSEETLESDRKDTLESLKYFEKLDRENLSSEQNFICDILLGYLRSSAESYDHTWFYEPFAYTSGLQANLPITLSEYAFRSRQDVEDYLELLEQTRDYFQKYLEFEEIKSQKGLFMAESCAEEVIRQCSEFIADPEDNMLLVTFDDRIEAVEGLTEDEIGEYKQRNRDCVKEYIIPAYEDTVAKFEELKSTGKNQLGLSHLDGGAGYYKYLLASMTGSSRSPEEVIELLDRSLENTFSDFLDLAMNNEDSYNSYFEDYENFYTDLEPRETILYLKDAFSSRFPEMPESEFELKEVHDSLKDIVSPAFFMVPPIDGYLNNTIYTNSKGSGAGSPLISLLAHEGIPGHMYQNTYFWAKDPSPVRSVLSFDGYSEGWATYVEMMSFDYYDYSDPLYADFERFEAEMELLVSARIEIGVNYEGWDLEQTKSFLNDYGLNSEAAEDIMDYVIAEPVNYQQYCLGWLEFEELRAMAEDELGDAFDEKEFHRTLLDAGPCQFDLLRDKVEEYVGWMKFTEQAA